MSNIVARLTNLIEVSENECEREFYTELRTEIERLRAELAAERERCAALEAALRDVLRDIAEYERANNLAPNPGRAYCWDSVARAYAAIRKGEP